MFKPVFTPVVSPYLVPFDGTFQIAKTSTKPAKGGPDKATNVEALQNAVAQFAQLQKRLYASDKHSLLLVFQAMDAAGKDGTISAVMSGVNPQGCQVTAFKAPTAEELDHDFLWRVQRALPERGRIGVWNRSHYEETLVVRVHPSYLDGQRLPNRPPLEDLWPQRFESINAAEKHWAQNGAVILKFFLNVSQAEQHQRFIERIDDPSDNWKFNARDVAESERWQEYQAAYQAAMAATSTPWAPWYAIPADSKSYMRRAVADIIVGTLSQLDLAYPVISADDKAKMAELRAKLVVTAKAK
jgi:PPK2 family polyphosphate:nucleotide phosphotransferase